MDDPIVWIMYVFAAGVGFALARSHSGRGALMFAAVPLLTLVVFNVFTESALVELFHKCREKTDDDLSTTYSECVADFEQGTWYVLSLLVVAVVGYLLGRIATGKQTPTPRQHSPDSTT